MTGGDEGAALGSIAPTQNLHPFAGFEILVVAEEMLDLIERDLRQIGIIVNLLVARRELLRRHGDELLVAAMFVLHQQHADDPAIHYRARRDRAGIDHDDIARVAIFRQRMRDEAVIAGVAHRRIEKAIDEERAGGLVHLIFDGFAADRDFDDDIDILGRILAGGNGVEIHCSIL